VKGSNFCPLPPLHVGNCSCFIISELETARAMWGCAAFEESFGKGPRSSKRHSTQPQTKTCQPHFHRSDRWYHRWSALSWKAYICFVIDSTSSMSAPVEETVQAVVDAPLPAISESASTPTLVESSAPQTEDLQSEMPTCEPTPSVAPCEPVNSTSEGVTEVTASPESSSSEPSAPQPRSVLSLF
jgi:hypothetical protein